MVILFFLSCKREGDSHGEIIYNEKLNKQISARLSEFDKTNNLEHKRNLIEDLYKKLKKVDSNKDTKLLFEVLNRLFLVNDWENYLEGSRELLSIAKNNRDTLGIANAYRSLGNFYFKDKVLDSAFYYYTKAEKNYFFIKSYDDYTNILFKKGIVQFEINDFVSSEYTFSRAYYFTNKFDSSLKKYYVLNYLGLTADQLGEYDRAISYYEKAEFYLNKDQENNNLLPIIKSNIGLTYTNLEKHNLAIKYYNESLNFNNLEIENPLLYANILDNLATSKFKIKDFNGLEDLYFKSLKIRQENGFISHEITSLVHLSEYYQSKNDTKNALKYIQKALLLAKKDKIPSDLLLAYKQASKVVKINQVNFGEKYISLKDSLQKVELNNKDRFNRIQLETEEILQQKDSLEKKNRNILNYFIGTIAVGGLLFFMRAQRAKSRELLLRQAQQRANEDIYRLIISQQNKLEEGRVLEKNRIAKELHDGVLGRLFGLRLNLDGLNHRNDDDAIHERIRCLEELKNIEQDLREISHELSREKYVLVNNFVAIVNNLVDEQAKINPAKLNAVIGENIDWDQLNNTTKINLYRILQESLQNINKYANAKTIKVEFRKDKKGNLVLNITDDGDGFEVDKKSKGIGLKNIVTRTHESNGIIEIKSAQGKGTRISITVPLEHKNIKS